MFTNGFFLNKPQNFTASLLIVTTYADSSNSISSLFKKGGKHIVVSFVICCGVMHLSSASPGEGRGSQADVGLALGRFFLLANYSLFGKTKHLKGNCGTKIELFRKKT